MLAVAMPLATVAAGVLLVAVSAWLSDVSVSTAAIPMLGGMAVNYVHVWGLLH